MHRTSEETFGNQDKVQKSVREGTLGIRSIKCQSGIFSKWLSLWQNYGLWKSVLTSLLSVKEGIDAQVRHGVQMGIRMWFWTDLSLNRSG